MLYWIISFYGGSAFVYMLIIYIYRNQDYLKNMYNNNKNNMSFYWLKTQAMFTIFKNKYLTSTKTTDNFYFDSPELKIQSHQINDSDKTLVSVNNVGNDYTESNIKFMLVEVKTINETYNISLHTVKRTFYIIDNILDYYFVLWYLNNISDTKNKLTMDDIEKVTIMDNKYKAVHLGKNERIQIRNFDYIILKPINLSIENSVIRKRRVGKQYKRENFNGFSYSDDEIDEDTRNTCPNLASARHFQPAPNKLYKSISKTI